MASAVQVGAADASHDRNLIDIVGLKKYFPIRGGLLKRAVGAVRAVDDVTLFIRKGETLGLVGESGCGKTTVGRSIMMLTPPTDGYVFYWTPRQVVADFTRLLNLWKSTEGLHMTPRVAGQLLELVDRLLSAPQCEVSPGKKRNICSDARKLMAHVSAVGPGGKLGTREEDVRELVEEAIEEVASRYCINYRRKSEIKRLRGRVQFVFQDPFASLDPKMLIKDIVSEPLKAQKKWRQYADRRIPLSARDLEKAQEWYSRLSESDKRRVIATRLGEVREAQAGAGPATPPERLPEDIARRYLYLEAKNVRKKTIALLEKVGLNVEHLYRFPHEFSGGQRQRIGIARALSVDPEFVVLDEPTSALDVSVQAQILNMLNQLQDDFGLTYLFISHDLSTIRYMCDRVAVMYLGKVVEYAEKKELFERPTHPYTEALLSVIPVPDPDLKRDRIILPGDVPSPANPPPGCRFHTRCPVATDICRFKEPELVDIGGEHFVACHVRAPSKATSGDS